MRLENFLSSKPLYYKKFDPIRIQKAYASIEHSIPKPRIVHLIGTNGKGSTGRYLAEMLLQCGCKVGHYTSPHICSFNERIWMDGKLADDKTLDAAFDALISVLDTQWQESLSYFEFTTLVAMMAFRDCDIVVLEAGLGGEHDGTSVFDNELTLLTPIGLDHAEFLGTTIQEVALTKIRGIQKAVITAKQEPEVMEVLQKEALRTALFWDTVELNEDDTKLVELFSQRETAAYLLRNFSHALAALRYLGFKQNINTTELHTLFGRLTPIGENLIIDVGHNLLAAKEILAYYGNSKVNLVYNTFTDKDYENILDLLKPIINKLFIIPVDDKRALKTETLQTTLEKLEISYETFSQVDTEKKTLVFGSFTVVEAFLKLTGRTDNIV